MGSLQAREMASRLKREEALSWHLRYNHYPSVGFMYDACLEALEALESEDLDREIALPENMEYKGQRTAPAWVFVQTYHLEDLVQPAPPDDDPPSIEQILPWESEGGCEATDGCWVEPDGTCEHGCSSWLIVMGLI